MSCQSANGNLIDAHITSLTTGAVTVNVQQALAVTVLAVSVMAAKIPAGGVTVNSIAVEAGRVIP